MATLYLKNLLFTAYTGRGNVEYRKYDDSRTDKGTDTEGRRTHEYEAIFDYMYGERSQDYTKHAPDDADEHCSHHNGGSNLLEFETDTLICGKGFDTYVLHHAHESAQEADDHVTGDLNSVCVYAHGTGCSLIIAGNIDPVAELMEVKK